MRMLLAWLSFLVVSAVPGLPAAALDCPATAVQAMNLPASRAAIRAGRALTIVALGSSSTEGVGASTPDQGYPAQLQAMLREALPNVAVRVLNQGRGGQEVDDMLARLDRDVIAARPTLLIWQAGTNAVLRGMDPVQFTALLGGGLSRLDSDDTDLVLMDSQRAPRVLSVPAYERFDAALRTLASAARISLFSRANLMREWEAAGVPYAAFLAPDGLHHNDRGYACLADALARAILAGLRDGHAAAR